MENIKNQEEEKTKKEGVSITLKLALCAGGLALGGYLIGASRGLEIGRIQGRNRGYLEGFEQGTKHIAAIVKDANGKID